MMISLPQLYMYLLVSLSQPVDTRGIQKYTTVVQYSTVIMLFTVEQFYEHLDGI